jgi:hypothetical protein
MRLCPRGPLWLFATAEAVAFIALWWDLDLEGFAGVIVGGTMGLGGLFVLLAHDEAVLPQPGLEGDND